MFVKRLSKKKLRSFYIKILCVLGTIVSILGIGFLLSGSVPGSQASKINLNPLSSKFLSGMPSPEKLNSEIPKPPSTKSLNSASNKGGSKSSSSKDSNGSGSDAGSGSSSSESSSDAEANAPFYDAAMDVSGKSKQIDQAKNESSIGGGQQTGKNSTSQQSPTDDLSGDSNPGRQWSRIAGNNSAFTSDVTNTSGFNIASFLNPYSKTDNSSDKSVAQAEQNSTNVRSEGLAGEYQKTLTALGLDHSSSNGLNNSDSSHLSHLIFGFLLIFAYCANYLGYFLLDFFGKFVTDLQPLFWLTKAGSNPSNPLYGAAQFIKRCVYWLSQLGLIWAFLFWMVTFGLGWLGFKGLAYRGGSHVGGAMKATLVYFVKVISIVVMAGAVVSLSSFLISFFQGPLSSNYDNMTEEAVQSGFINFKGWVENSRLQLPKGVDLPAPNNPSKDQYASKGAVSNVKPYDILKINGQEAGMNESGDLPETAEGQTGEFLLHDNSKGYLKNHSNPYKTMESPENQASIHMLTDWTRSQPYQAADFASRARSEMPGVSESDPQAVKTAIEDPMGNPQGSGSDSSQSKSGSSFLQAIGLGNAIPSNPSDDSSSNSTGYDRDPGNGQTGASNGYDNYPYINASAISSTNEPDSNTDEGKGISSGEFYSDDGGHIPNSARDVGGLSALGMYNYLSSIPDGTNIEWTGSPKLQNKFTAPEHYSVSLVGTGALAFGNYVRVLGLLLALAVLCIQLMLLAYDIVIKNDFIEIKNAMKTATGSIAAARDLVAMAIAMFEELIGIWISLHVGRALILALGDWISTSAEQKLASGLAMLAPHHDMILAGVTGTTGYGVLETLTGAGMIFAAYKCSRYAKLVNSTIAGGVRGTTDRFMNAMNGNVGRGMAMTRRAAASGGHPLLGAAGIAAGGHALRSGGGIPTLGRRAAGALNRAAGRILGHSPGKGESSSPGKAASGKSAAQQKPTISPKDVRGTNNNNARRGKNSNLNGRGRNARLNRANHNNNPVQSGTKSHNPSAQGRLNAQNTSNAGRSRSAVPGEKAGNYAQGGANFNGSQADSMADDYGNLSSAINSDDANAMSPLNSGNGIQDSANPDDINSVAGDSSADQLGGSDANVLNNGNNASNAQSQYADQNARKSALDSQNALNRHGINGKHKVANSPHNQRAINPQNRHALHRVNSSNGRTNNRNSALRNNANSAKRAQHQLAGISQNRHSMNNISPRQRMVGNHRVGSISSPQEVAQARKSVASARNGVRNANRQAANYRLSGSHSQVAENALNSRINTAHRRLGGAARYATAVTMDSPINAKHSNLVSRPGVTYGNARSALRNVASSQHNVATAYHALSNPTSMSSRNMLSHIQHTSGSTSPVSLGNVYNNALSGYNTARKSALHMGLNPHAMTSPRQTKHSLDQIQTHLTTALNAHNWNVNDI